MHPASIIALAMLLAACGPGQDAAVPGGAAGNAPANAAAVSGAAAARDAAAANADAAAPAGHVDLNATPRTADGRPDLNGIWQALSSANFNLEPHAASQGPTETLGAIGAVPPGVGVVYGGTIPYRPEARRQRDRNYANRRTEDPEARCYRPGIPRATYMPQPFQIFQTESEILMAYQYAKASRSVHIEDQTEAPIDSWMGWSNGHWEGDTLVVEVTGLNGKTWLDRAGNFMSENARVTERFSPEGKYHIWYEATIDDPTVFERPWTIAMMLYKQLDLNAELLEFKCVEFAEELLYGHLSKANAAAGGSADD